MRNGDAVTFFKTNLSDCDGLIIKGIKSLGVVVNFLMNYMNNALLPTKPEAWYAKNFATA